MVAHAIDERSMQALLHLATRDLDARGARFGDLVGNVKKLSVLLAARCVDPQARARSEGTNAFVKRVWLGNVAPQEKPHMACRLECSVNCAAL